LRAERGASRNTIAAYGSDLREIAQFISGQQSSFMTCSRRDLEAFFISRAAAGARFQFGRPEAFLPENALCAFFKRNGNAATTLRNLSMAQRRSDACP